MKTDRLLDPKEVGCSEYSLLYDFVLNLEEQDIDVIPSLDEIIEWAVHIKKVLR